MWNPSYQRRADLIPNLVEVVKGYAKHEADTLKAVTEARAKVGSMQVNKDILNNPASLNKFQQAQGELSGALSRLMVVVEKYPDLKANQNFMDLQKQLEGTENRINVARERYNAVGADLQHQYPHLPQLPDQLPAAAPAAQGTVQGRRRGQDSAQGEVLTVLSGDRNIHMCMKRILLY